MSYRRFNGWEPRRVTEYERNSDGRVVRAVTTTEPEWDDAERQWMTALGEFEDGQCPGCGGQFAETSDPGNEGAYIVDLPDRCFKCSALAEHLDRQGKSGFEAPPHPHALHYHVHKK